MEKLIITCAVQGAETTREDNPHLPLTPEEVADAAYEAWQAGAAVLHLHVRDREGRPTQDAAVFADHIDRVRARCDMVIQVSTGGALGMTREERAAPLTLRPEMASLSTGTVNFGRDVFFNPPDLVEFLAGEMQKYGVRPEVEVFDVGFVENACGLVRRGLLQPPLHFNLVMGVPGGIPATVPNLVHLVSQLPEGSTWSVAGISRHQLPMAVAAMVMGGHVRVGFEDNVYYRRGEPARSNAQLVARVVRIAQELGRTPATPDEAREILRIRGKVR